MADFALNESERAFLRALAELDVAFMVVGLSAAVLQGADRSTVDIDLWFEDREDPRIHEAAKRAGGVWVPSSFGMPPCSAATSSATDSMWCSHSKRAAGRRKDLAALPSLEAALAAAREA